MTQVVDQAVVQAVECQKRKIPMLAKRRDFLRVAATRKKWVSGSMIVQVAPAENHKAEHKKDHSSEQESDTVALLTIRVGYTASKKVGNAVRRSRAKRRLREVVRRVLWDKGEKGHDYVLIARTATVEVPFDQLIRDFSWCLKRLSGHKSSSGQGNDRPDRRRKPEHGRGRGGKV
ncbi:MAG: ribonuclease P protein component [Emcibacter sp.]|nr:ribonuclease P protein component [Emcibacter sp.]